MKKNGVLVDSSDEIDLVADGAEARHGQHRVHWAANLNTPGPNGAVRLLTPGRKALRSRIFGISYWDTASDTNLLIGELQDTQGLLVGSNQVVYPDAFRGSVKADVCYRNSVEGMEQNIVFREKLPAPADLNLDPKTTVLQILTEFFAPPARVKSSSTNDGLGNDMLIYKHNAS